MKEESSTNIWLLLEVLTNRRGLILGLVLLAVVASVVISLLLPVWYEASALLLPSKDLVTPVSSIANLAEVASIAGGLELPIMVTPSDVYARMLGSRTIVDRIIETYDLKTRYNARLMLEAREELLKRARFRVTDEGFVSVKVEDKDPEMAATITNGFVDELNSINQQIVSGRARQSREFIEARLEIIRIQLDSARNDLEVFQTQNRALDFNEQTRLVIGQATQLKIDLAHVNIEIGLRQRVLGTDNPELIELKNRQKSIEDQLEELEFGGNENSYLALPLASIPRLRGEYEEIYSRVKVTESVYTTLLELLEQAKIQERAESTPLMVLDRATVPEIRSRPQRTLIVTGSTVITFIIALLLATFLEYLRRLQGGRPDDYSRALQFINAYFGWLPGVRRRPGTY